MTADELEAIRREIRHLRSRTASSSQLESLARRLGRVPEGGKKEPQWKSAVFRLPRISIPKGWKDLPAGTRNNILSDFESMDIPQWEAKLGLVEKEDDEENRTYTYRGITRTLPQGPVRTGRDPRKRR